MPPDPRVHVGVCAFVYRTADNALLMVQRTGTVGTAADGHGTWALPGGWVDFDETPNACAVREVLEETGVAVKYASDMGWVSNLSDDGQRHIVTLFVACHYIGGEPTVTEPDKCGAVEWVPRPRDGRPLFKPLLAWWERSL